MTKLFAVALKVGKEIVERKIRGTRFAVNDNGDLLIFAGNALVVSYTKGVWMECRWIPDNAEVKV